jgi:hypothetical protein
MPDANSIKDLPDTSKIDDATAYLVPGKWLRIIFDILTQLWRGENVNKGPNIRIRQYGLGGYSISGANQPGGSGVAGGSPWQVTMRPDPDNPGQFQAMVNVNSDLLNSLCPNDWTAVTGLGSWFPLIANDVIWIYIIVAGSSGYFTVTSGTIQSYGMGNSGFNPSLYAWDNTGGYVQNDGGSPPNQIAANVMIAYTQPDTNGNPYLFQACSTHLMMRNLNIDGEAAIFPLPSPYRRYGLTVPS